MGVQFGAKTISEFDIDGNGLDELYVSKSPFLNFASSVYYDRHLYISGGAQDHIYRAKSNVTEFTFKVKESTGKLSATVKEFPKLK